MTWKLVMATANKDKARDITAVLFPVKEIELLPRPTDLPDVEETGSTLVENARLKAVAVVEATSMAAIADDTGLEVDALGGGPGVYSSRYAGEDASYADNVNKLLTAMAAQKDRTARFRSVCLVRFPDGRELVTEGVVEGRILREARGNQGFGYDPVFVPIEGDGRSFGQMPITEKATMSHRARAFLAMAELLTNL